MKDFAPGQNLIMFHAHEELQARASKTMKDCNQLENLIMFHETERASATFRAFIMFHEHEELQVIYYTLRENADNENRGEQTRTA